MSLSNKAVGKVEYIRFRSPTVAIELRLLFYIVVVFVSMYFRVRQVNQN